MIDPFEELIKELGEALDVNLHVDERGVCKLLVEDHLHIQLEPFKNPERLIMACFLGEVSPGKFRENLLKTALKTNFLFPEQARLSHCFQNNQLTLFQVFPPSETNGKQLAKQLHLFIDKALTWKTALEKGQLEALIPLKEKPKNSSMFGL